MTKIETRSSKMLLHLLSIFTVALAHPQNIDPGTLAEIFGTPSGYEGSTQSTKFPKLEDITIRPTASGTLLVNEDGEPCQCVPYYLCDNSLNGVNIKNASVTGFGVLDIRFGEGPKKRKCEVSIEKCCTTPKTEPEPEPEPEPVTPNPTTVRGCGYRNPQGIDFTVTGGNGNEAEFGEFPWVVALLDASDLSYIGVGVLIHPQVVMTAAHVAAKSKPGSLLARAGEWDTQTTKERLKSQEQIAQDIIIRDDFIAKSLKNDIALIRLEQPFQLAEHIGTLCLPDADEDFDSYKKCIANGWGKDKFGKIGRYAVILKKVELNMVPFNICSALLKQTRLGNRFKLHDSFVCAGGEEGKDTCQGDGGAPLACPIGKNRYKLTGLVAWGIGCGGRNTPAVYVKVSKYRDWIDGVMTDWGFSAN